MKKLRVHRAWAQGRREKARMPSVMEKPSSGSGILSRSRAKTAPNGGQPHSEDDSSEEEHSHDSMIRVGTNYQAVIPECKPVDKYIAMAKEKHGYNIEQALGMLLWHKHDVEKSLADLANFTPFPDEWTVEDKVLFEQAFGFHGKCFQRIQQMLPDKLIPSLVKYYYSWKKTRTRTSVMDRQARRLGGRKDKDESSDELEEGRGAASEGEPDAGDPKREPPPTRPLNARPGPGKKEAQLSQYRHHPLRTRRRPPKGMYLSPEGITAVSGSPDLASLTLRGLDAQLISLKRQVQSMKQTNSSLRQALEGGIDPLRPPEANTKFNSRWTTDEQLLAVQAIRRYGKDFGAIAEVIGNKTLTQVKTFFVSYRRRFNLEEVLQEWEAEQDGAAGAPAPPEEARKGAPGPAAAATATTATTEEEEEVQITAVSRSVPPVQPTPPPPTSLSQPPPLLRPPLPTAPTLLRQPPPLQQGRFLQPRLAPNQPPPPLIRPALAASRHSARSGPQPPPALLGGPSEPLPPSL
ncbi:REST corepressor 2 isoform X3 [Monodelphis domestica]|uniref:REST corepressor 2 isoform X3 n=1 Tax=Monodelphis domestica TaxID=13616 RepID=UPI0024E1ADFB|nr:REST corepressor 2 isoform X3 [Monodelphis domestica]